MSVRRLIVLLVGLAVVVAVSALGLIRAYERAHTVQASDAVVESDISIVGTAFAGSISDVSVSPGDTVAAGQELFRLQSPTLQQARETSRFNEEGVGYRMEGEDVMIFEATGSGTVAAMPYGVGSFVPANTEITQIVLHDSLRVRAELDLTAADYSRLKMGSTLRAELPDRSVVDASVYDIAFQEGEEGRTAVVRARSEELAAGGQLLDGSPVAADVELESADGIGAWAAREASGLLSPRSYE